MPEHTVTIDSIGGSTVLSCATLSITTIEYPFTEVTAEGIKDTILKYKYLKEEDAHFDIKVIDNRAEPVNFNEQRQKESKEFKASRTTAEFRN